LGDTHSTKKNFSKNQNYLFWTNITQVSKKGNFDFWKNFFCGMGIAQKGIDQQGT
jgi:hypothetical protein